MKLRKIYLCTKPSDNGVILWHSNCQSDKVNLQKSPSIRDTRQKRPEDWEESHFESKVSVQ